MSISSCLAWAMTALLILSPSLTLSVSAQDTPTNITLTFYNDAGEPIEAATLSIPRALCVNFNPDLLVDGYASVVASEPQAALNLYPSPHCPFLTKSTVGFWNNTDAVLNTLSVRYEGLAPNTAPGTLTDTAFPPNMYVQPRIPDPEDSGKGANPADWVLDPEKGKIVVIVVAAVLGIGVSIGLYAVYQAAQYKAPPKKKKEKKFKGLQTKKVKKKDAYYQKPVKEANTTAPLLSNMTPPGTPGHPTNKTSKSTEARLVSSSTSSFSPPVSRGSMQERRTHEAPVLIDMQETNLRNKSSSNTISSGRTMTSVNSPNNSPPRRGPGGSGPGPVSATNTGVKPSIITASSTPPAPPPNSSGSNARTSLNVPAPSTSSPLALSSHTDLIQFTSPMTQLNQLRPQFQQQQQQQQRSSFQPQPYQQYPPPPSLQKQQPRPGFPQLQQRPQRPQITTQYQPPPMNSQSPPTSPTGRGGFGVPRGGMGGRGGLGSTPGRGGYSGGGGGYSQRPPQNYQVQQGLSMSSPARTMSPPARAMSPTGPTSPTRGRGSNEILVPLQPIHNSNSGYVLPPPSTNPGIQQQHRQQRPPRPADNSRSR
ncbi:hypothetical protein BGZ81_005993 [Podila clonocystis]|nr:hypothetical protein BGZ81_005993 [Podila clonocystis]